MNKKIQDRSKDEVTSCADDNCKKCLGVVQVKPLTDSNKASNKRPDSAYDWAYAGNDEKHHWKVGKPDHPQHFIDICLASE